MLASRFSLREKHFSFLAIVFNLNLGTFHSPRNIRTRAPATKSISRSALRLAVQHCCPFQNLPSSHFDPSSSCPRRFPPYRRPFHFRVSVHSRFSRGSRICARSACRRSRSECFGSCKTNSFDMHQSGTEIYRSEFVLACRREFPIYILLKVLTSGTTSSERWKSHWP